MDIVYRVQKFLLRKLTLEKIRKYIEHLKQVSFKNEKKVKSNLFKNCNLFYKDRNTIDY